MIKLFIKAGISPFQVDDFPKDSKRSIKGALHFKPASMKIVTNDEWKEIEKRKLSKFFVKQPEIKVVEKQPEVKAKKEQEKPKTKKLQKSK